MRSAGIEDTVVRIEEDVTVDILVAASDALKGAEACAAVGTRRTKVHILGRDCGIAAAANLETESWESGAAREDIAALRVVKCGPLDRSVVL